MQLDCPLFETVTHASGIASYLLKARVAPQQQTFYYVNNGATRDGRFVWFYCSFPPSGDANYGRTLGVMDFESGELRHFPETQFSHASPWVDPENGWIYWGTGRMIWKRGPLPGQLAEKVGEVPKALIGWRTVDCTATHLSRSADQTEFFIDLRTPTKTFLGTMKISTGAFESWTHLDGTWDHAQFHPTDPDLVLFSQEFHVDPITGRRIHCEDRMWLMRRGGKPEPVFASPTICTHEWWSHDGKSIYAIGGGQGTWKVDLQSREKLEIWPRGNWHSHSSQDDHYLVGDYHQGFLRGCESWVAFKNLKTGKEIEFAHNPAMANDVGANYHVDPHPRFIIGDQFVTYTTTKNGRLDVAFVKTADLIAATQ